jgi:hypothetical protein
VLREEKETKAVDDGTGEEEEENKRKWQRKRKERKWTIRRLIRRK